MMELSSKSKLIKKKHKKKKIRIPENALTPLIKPDIRNGESNWMKLQKIIEPVKRESSNKDSERNMLKTTGINLNAKDCNLPFTHKASFSSKFSSQNGGLQNGSKYERKHVQNKRSNVNTNSLEPVLQDPTKKTCGDKSPSFEFNFNSSVDNLSLKNKSEHEIIENGASSKQDKRKLTKAVAMDCEMVGTGPKGDDSIIARVSIVNSHGDCLYDEFVKPREKVTDFRTKVSGVRPSDLKNGKDLFEVQNAVLSIIEGRILVGHSIKHDLDVLFISHPRHLIRDTAFYKPFRDICGGKTPSLKKLTSKILGCEIQSGEHSSIEDAQAAMLLYLRHKREWESLIKSQRRKPKMIENQSKS